MKSTNEIIQQIKDGTLREDASVEMKMLLRNKDVIAKVLVGLANTGGGHLIVGVEELAGTCKTSGMKQDEYEIRKFVDSVCKDFCINIKAKFFKVNFGDGSDVLIVEILPTNPVTYYSRPTSPERLYAFTRKKDGRMVQSADTKTYQKIYKYMTLETFMTCLYTGTWRFFEPNKWQDKYERRFYCADYQFPNAEDAAPKLFATCVTRERNGEAS